MMGGRRAASREVRVGDRVVKRGGRRAIHGGQAGIDTGCAAVKRWRLTERVTAAKSPEVFFARGRLGKSKLPLDVGAVGRTRAVLCGGAKQTECVAPVCGQVSRIFPRGTRSGGCRGAARRAGGGGAAARGPGLAARGCAGAGRAAAREAAAKTRESGAPRQSVACDDGALVGEGGGRSICNGHFSRKVRHIRAANGHCIIRFRRAAREAL